MLVFEERGNAGTNTNVFNPASNLPDHNTRIGWLKRFINVRRTYVWIWASSFIYQSYACHKNKIKNPYQLTVIFVTKKTAVNYKIWNKKVIIINIPLKNGDDLGDTGDLGGSGGAESGMSCMEWRFLFIGYVLGGKVGADSRRDVSSRIVEEFTPFCKTSITNETTKRSSSHVRGKLKKKPWSFCAVSSPNVRQSGFRIRRNLCLWNLEPWALESGMQPKEPGIPLRIETWNPSSTDKGSGIQYLESGIHSLESSPIHQDCLGLAYMGQILSSGRRQSNLRPNGSTLTETLRAKRPSNSNYS